MAKNITKILRCCLLSMVILSWVFSIRSTTPFLRRRRCELWYPLRRLRSSGTSQAPDMGTLLNNCPKLSFILLYPLSLLPGQFYLTPSLSITLSYSLALFVFRSISLKVFVFFKQSPSPLTTKQNWFGQNLTPDTLKRWITGSEMNEHFMNNSCPAGKLISLSHSISKCFLRQLDREINFSWSTKD